MSENNSASPPEAVYCFVNDKNEVVAMSVICPSVIPVGESIVRYALSDPDSWRIVTQLADIAEGLANSNSGAEEIATRLAEQARAALAKARGEQP